MVKRSKNRRRSPAAGQPASVETGKSFAVRLAPSRGKLLLQALVIVVAVVWIYQPALHGGWLWDDRELIALNALVHDPDGLRKIWLEPANLIDYQPVTVSVEWLQWRLWGDNTMGYHLLNVILHLLSALLVWRLLGKFGLRLAWLGGLIFALYPVTVESVAWMAELKNTLSLPPFLLAMGFYMDYEERGRKRDYFLALGLFLAAMLCKATMVMFPAVILLYVWWKRGRIGWGDLKASAPFFVLSLALGCVTVWFLQQHAIGRESIPLGGFFSRLALVGSTVLFYLAKAVLPVGLLPIYPKWSIDPPSPWQFLPWLLLGVVIGWLWTKRAGWGRHVLLGLGFFLINLLPFVGFTAGSYMIFTWVADHILYIPILGWIGLLTAALGQIHGRLPAALAAFGIGICGVLVVLLAFESRGYAGQFISQETLWSYTLRYNPQAWLAYNNLGDALLDRDQVPEAIEKYKQAIKLRPDYAEAHNNLGNAYARLGQTSEAVAQFEIALGIRPDYPEAHYDLGNVLMATGRLPEAMDHYREAVRLKPGAAETHNNLAVALLRTGRISEAMEQSQEALRIKPGYAAAYANLALALQQSGRVPEAIEQYEQSLKFDPDNVETRYNFGNALMQAGRLTEARQEYESVLRIKPDHAGAHTNLGIVFARQGQIPQAIGEFEAALRIDPANAGARDDLAHAQALLNPAIKH